MSRASPEATLPSLPGPPSGMADPLARRPRSDLRVPHGFVLRVRSAGHVVSVPVSGKRRSTPSPRFATTSTGSFTRSDGSEEHAPRRLTPNVIHRSPLTQPSADNLQLAGHMAKERTRSKTRKQQAQRRRPTTRDARSARSRRADLTDKRQRRTAIAGDATTGLAPTPRDAAKGGRPRRDPNNRVLSKIVAPLVARGKGGRPRSLRLRKRTARRAA